MGSGRQVVGVSQVHKQVGGGQVCVWARRVQRLAPVPAARVLTLCSLLLHTGGAALLFLSGELFEAELCAVQAQGAGSAGELSSARDRGGDLPSIERRLVDV